MKVLAIVANFPSLNAPYSGIFIKRTLTELSRFGAEVTIIAPQKWHEKKMPNFSIENGLTIYRPRYLSLGARNFLSFNTIKLTHRNFSNSVFKVLKKNSLNPDYVYSHFLMPAGVTALKIAQHLGVNTFCSLGESDILNYERFHSQETLKTIYIRFTKIFPNSLPLKKIILERYALEIEKVIYIPNGIDSTKFYPMDKIECRKKLKLPLEEKIILFVGSFIERKGPFRVLEVCRRLSKPVKMIFIGKGNQLPKDSNILFSGQLNPESLVLYLNSCDVFILPTKNEGMPNAILEAMACQIPIVTSDIEINKIILEGYENKRLCEYDNIDCLAESMEEMLLIQPVSSNNIKYTIEKRAKRILNAFQA
jgi:glycosyltransferase involved in cell wall biosynthesis